MNNYSSYGANGTAAAIIGLSIALTAPVYKTDPIVKHDQTQIRVGIEGSLASVSWQLSNNAPSESEFARIAMNLASNQVELESDIISFVSKHLEQILD